MQKFYKLELSFKSYKHLKLLIGAYTLLHYKIDKSKGVRKFYVVDFLFISIKILQIGAVIQEL